MPKKPINYAKTIIYTIRTGNSLYVGSTTDYTNRKCQHKSSITNENGKDYNYKLYKTIKEYKKVYSKQYYIENKDKFSEYKTENKDKISEYYKQKVTCECGCTVSRYSLTRHKKSKKHMKLMENK